MINKATFDFLTELAANNNRDWFIANKKRHDLAKNNVYEFCTNLIASLSKIDPNLPSALESKDCVMRIYRDVRFSKDKTPYKTNFSAGFSEMGRKFMGAGYYLHIHPEQSFLAGGCWMPEPAMLKSIRQEIDYNGSDFHKIVDDTTFKKYFGTLDPEFKLKTVPKGYPADHPDLEYLKLKSFTFSHPLDSSSLTASDAVDQVAEGFKCLYPFITFLRNAAL